MKVSSKYGTVSWSSFSSETKWMALQNKNNVPDDTLATDCVNKKGKKGKTTHFFFYLLSRLCSNYSNCFPMFTILFTDIRKAYLYVFPHFIAVISTLINITAWIGRKYESSLRFCQEKEHFFIAFI